MATRLVVIGNGMAGARTVEEILDRGGGGLFDITMFGAEPYGNYNRILLSNVLSGVDDESGIFLNDLDWYAANGINLYTGVRVTRIDRFAKVVFSDDSDFGTAATLVTALTAAEPGLMFTAAASADPKNVSVRTYDTDSANTGAEGVQDLGGAGEERVDARVLVIFGHFA